MSQSEQTDDFDTNLEAAGSFGRAQFILIVLAGYVSAYAGWLGYIPVFATREVDFYCADSFNMTSEKQYVQAAMVGPRVKDWLYNLPLSVNKLQ